VLVEAIAPAHKAGIDCPLGWPRRFVEFVAAHEAGAFVAPADLAGKDCGRQLALRETDLITRLATGRQRLRRHDGSLRPPDHSGAAGAGPVRRPAY